MKKVEEFNKTQILINEFKKLVDKAPELEQKIEGINKKEEAIKTEENLKIEATNLKIGRANLKIEKIEDEMNLVENDINRNEILKEYEKRIQEIKTEQDKELEELNKQKEEINKQREELNKQRENANTKKEEAENEKKEFYTDEKGQTITLEIKDMEKEISVGKLEIKKKEIELQQKDIELQEFYDQQEKENPLRWQEIYNEKDAIQKEIDEIKENIGAFEKKIEEYSNFKQEIFELKYPKITIELDDDMKVKDPNAKVESEADLTKDNPTKIKSTKVDSTKRVSINNVKIVISRAGLKIQAPNINKTGENRDEYNLTIKELKKEVEYWGEYLDPRGFLNIELTDEQCNKVDPNILTALKVLQYSYINKDLKNELISRYAKAITSDGHVSKDESLKGIIEYDKTGLQYWKLSSIFDKIKNFRQFNDIVKYADIAEDMGIAEVKQDEPGRLGKFFKKIKNSIFLPKTEEKGLLGEGRETEKKVTEFREELYSKEATDESNKKHFQPVVESDGDVLEKPVEEEVK